jgi:hypothetical protein
MFFFLPSFLSSRTISSEGPGKEGKKGGKLAQSVSDDGVLRTRDRFSKFPSRPLSNIFVVSLFITLVVTT